MRDKLETLRGQLSSFLAKMTPTRLVLLNNTHFTHSDSATASRFAASCHQRVSEQRNDPLGIVQNRNRGNEKE
jgi:hypothetical protein